MRGLIRNSIFFLILAITSCTLINPLGTVEKYTRQIIVTNGDSLIKARILIDPPDIKLNDELYYFWYYSDIINSNKGGFTGNLLDGPFIVIDGSKNLLTKGNFKNGLKDGEWKIWYPNGILHYSENWKEGSLSGEFKEFAESGELIEKSLYKKNLLDGARIQYYPDTTVTMYYQDGIELTGTQKKKVNFLPFEKVFKNKNDSTNNMTGENTEAQ